MTKTKAIIVGVLAVLFVGCPARSIFPLFVEKDLVFNPALVGTWVEENGKDTYTFQPSKEKSYNVIVREKKGDTAAYAVQLGKVGNFWFLDSYPAKESPDYHMIRTHVISKIQIDQDTLQLSSLESDWLKKMTESGKLKIPHVTLKNDMILTASTEELQKLVLRVADDTGAFPEPGKLSRLK